METSEMTWFKRFKAFFTAIMLAVGIVVHFLNPPQHTNADAEYGVLIKEIKANFAYFFGNPIPLQKFNEEYEGKSKKSK